MGKYTDKAVTELRSVRSEVEQELSRIDEAIALLGGVRETKKAKSTKPCCTKQEVVGVVERLLSDNETLTVAEIDGLAKDKFSREQNKSLSGFAMRLKEALADPRFTEFVPGQYRLAGKVTSH